ncbi:MAG: alpha/beta fold hydrolase [Chloroflexi bacterium]|nr:alpha/beta fold hydrolase [Chloroflexota bacterium]
MIVLLHGFGASMRDLAALSPAIEPHSYVYVYPNAPIEMQVGYGMTGYAWTGPGQDGPSDDGDRAESMLATLVQEVTERYRVAPGRTVLGGFSQGGMMTYRLGLPNPELFGGLAVLSGSVRDPDRLKERLPADRNQAIFIAHGTDDGMISVEDARETRRFLRDEGYAPEYREYPMGHEISQDVIQDLKLWLQRVLPPEPACVQRR